MIVDVVNVNSPQIQIGGSGCRVQARQNVSQLIRVLAAHAPRINLLIKYLQPFMTDGHNHCTP